MRIIVLHGRERFLIEEHTRRIAEMLEAHYGGVEQFRFDGGVVEPAAVLDELRSYGLMQPHKLVVLDNAEQFLAGGRAAPLEDDDESDGDSRSDDDDDSADRISRRPLMQRYAEGPVDAATLVMRAATWRKGNLDKLIMKHGVIVACDEQPMDKAAGWCISRCAKRYDAALDSDAAALMVLRLGPGLQRLDTELQKLAMMAGPGGRITRDLVSDQIPPSRDEAAWGIQSAVAEGRAATMLGRLHDLLDVSRHDPVPIAWAVTDVLRKEHAAAHLFQRGVHPQSIAKTIRLWGDTTAPVLAAAQRNPPHRLAQLLRDSILSDQRSKSGHGEAVRNLEALMVRIADVTGGDRHG